ncbi:class I SAM-dependent methyltransferase [Spirosoma utsteinense]|uniref:Ubiquinone/menaquinone biosynthesis C-methylase UbiE n=1 Tax=Spirosoma utsteinense TaxID=2585773 RepID=A0ABR6WCM8_9BACT|nr:class I SAM-dependent methyltransferase [Spirosoma utsteinense]MBC3785689.1 ubiquinone/menaquinone biosynthesis C-methylase UbiE [Spirosoma utsteinense]MBC3793735.1 ubiquinone/menaquinone biosynthesis C-methylase UbiE [Spirosoma utsteinense]
MSFSTNTTLNDTLRFNQNQVWSETDSFALERYAQFTQYLPQQALSVLDVGCNTGRGGQVLKQKKPHLKLWGIDMVEDRIRRIPGGVYEHLVAGSATSIPAEDNSFCAIVAGELVEHIPVAVFPTMLSEFYRVLKPGGRVLLTTPNPKSYLVYLRKHSIYADPSHVNIMHQKQLVDQLTKAGFVSTSVMGSGKVSRHLGDRFPLFNVYGSYLTISQKQ